MFVTTTAREQVRRCIEIIEAFPEKGHTAARASGYPDSTIVLDMLYQIRDESQIPSFLTDKVDAVTKTLIDQPFDA